MEGNNAELELFASDEELELELFADCNALASVSTGGSASTSSCPATSASSFSSMSTYG